MGAHLFYVEKWGPYLATLSLNNCKEQVHKGYPLAGPCICNYKTFAIRNNLFGSTVLFSPSSFFLIKVEWFWIVIECFSKHRQSKPLQTQTNYLHLLQNPCFQPEPNGDPIRAYQKTDVSQSESNEDPIRAYQKTEVFQSESNGDPIRAYQTREDLPELFRSLGGWSRCLVYYCESDHTPPEKNGGGVLYYCRCNITRDMLIRDVPRSESLFPETGCILERQIVRFAKMISRDKCSTLSDLASLFCVAGAIL